MKSPSHISTRAPARVRDAIQWRRCNPFRWRAHRARGWIVLYDARCGLCTWLLAGILRWDRERILKPVALQERRAARLLSDLSPEARMRSWHLIEPGGRRYSGGAALPPMLRELPWGRGPALLFARIPKLTDRGCRWVAANRGGLAKLVPARWKRDAGALVSARAHGRDHVHATGRNQARAHG